MHCRLRQGRGETGPGGSGARIGPSPPAAASDVEEMATRRAAFACNPTRATTPAGISKRCARRAISSEFVDAARDGAVDEQPDDAALRTAEGRSAAGRRRQRLAEKPPSGRTACRSIAVERHRWPPRRCALGHGPFSPVASRWRQPSIAALARVTACRRIGMPRLSTFGTRALAEQDAVPQRRRGRSIRRVVPPTRAAEGTIWADLNAVEAAPTARALPMVFIDTGAQQSIMTRGPPKSAGVDVGHSGHATGRALPRLDGPARRARDAGLGRA